MNDYLKRQQQHTSRHKQLQQHFTLVGYGRLISIILFIMSCYFYYKNGDSFLLVSCVIMLSSFLFLFKLHQKIKYNRNLHKKLVAINTDEIAYLSINAMPFDNGIIHVDHTHLFSFDLDLFGNNSLFQHLNRTATYIGNKTLANNLVNLLSINEIKPTQIAIEELASKLDFRQNLLATSMVASDNESTYNKVINWSEQPVVKQSQLVRIISFVLPFLLICIITTSVISGKLIYVYLSNFFFLLNLLVLVFQIKNIKKEIIDANKIYQTINQYARIITIVEEEKFESEHLKKLQHNFLNQDDLASKKISQLSRLFSSISSLENGMAAIIFNGFLLYHVHVLFALLKWKNKHAAELQVWLKTIGEFESLNSLANLSYNNPQYSFPALNTKYEISFQALGHPLINEQKRVCNDVTFKDNNFMILTGSNMSGKSTFLRTLGINMVLAHTGAPVCALAATIHPLPVIVSMRVSDSLSDNESYFFAEVKRLKQIMNNLDQTICFVLLDEILRGTNSDDKRIGTIEVVKKIIQKNAIGAIATHDLEVCNITANYPNKLMNKCFEVEIINDNLEFDYKLRDGICKNKSATFLMKKMEII